MRYHLHYSDDRTVIEWDEVEDGQIKYSGFIAPADAFADFADGSSFFAHIISRYSGFIDSVSLYIVSLYCVLLGLSFPHFPFGRKTGRKPIDLCYDAYAW